MRALVFALGLWSLSACSAVTLAVRGEATVPMLYGRPSLTETANGAQLVGRTGDLTGGKPLKTVGLAVRNSTSDKLMEVDWREVTVVGLDGKAHLVRPAPSQLSAPGELQGTVTIPPHQTARLDVTPVDEAILGMLPLEPKPGTVVSAGTLRVPIVISGATEVAELPLTFFTEADAPPGVRPRLRFSYATRIPFEPGLGGLLGTMCFITAGYFGGLCWLYLIFPTSGQKDRAFLEAEESLHQQYGTGARIVTSETVQVGW